jgi:hypothetical protein
VVVSVADGGSPGCGSIAAMVRLGTTVPCRLTAAAAPVVVYWTIVWVASAHVTIAKPFVVLLAQLPLPDGTGSWYCLPPIVTASPAETVPLAGPPASLDWQLLRPPWKLYAPGESSRCYTAP